MAFAIVTGIAALVVGGWIVWTLINMVDTRANAILAGLSAGLAFALIAVTQSHGIYDFMALKNANSIWAPAISVLKVVFMLGLVLFLLCGISALAGYSDY